MIRIASLVLLLAALAPAAQAAPCPPAEAQRRSSGQDCTPAEKPKPYDPDVQRAGRTPGFIDFGNGTEVRVGGRVQMDYDTRRR